MKSLIVVVAQCCLLQQVFCGNHITDYADIAGYDPGSDVTQHNRIDLDQKEMEAALAADNFPKAQAIYETGGNSGAYATVTVAATQAVKSGQAVTQVGSTGKGKVKKDKASGTSVDITYTSTCVDNPKAGWTTTSDCFKKNVGVLKANGSIEIGNPTEVTNKYRTLKGFSTKAGGKMAEWPDFKKFVATYTHTDYADRYVMDAFKGDGAWANQEKAARIQGIKKGTAYMNVWMYVIHEMEDAIQDCKSDCQNCNDDPVHAWDEAVAFYTGTGEGIDGLGKGYLLYNLADKRCQNYKTCAGGTVEGVSQVNTEIFKLFKQGLDKLTKSKCTELGPIKNQIVSLMTVPLIQGALRYAYKVDKLQGKAVEKAEGAVFAQAVLPMVEHCSKTAAATIKKNMAIDATTPMVDGVAKVKAAFESTYPCLNIKCAHIGGLIKTTKPDTYYDDFKPCTDPVTTSDSKGNSMFFAVAVISYIITFATQ